MSSTARVTVSALESHAPQPVPPAVVVGLCAHGLATTRALTSAGVSVIAVETDSRLPGFRTRLATVVRAGPINGPGLANTLVDLARRSAWPSRPVLFLMNDKMVKEVAENWGRLAPYYRISWESSRETVLRLQSKNNLPEVCAANGVKAPATVDYAGEHDAAVLERVPFPAIVKPALPMGGFKAVIAHRVEDVVRLARRHATSLPFVVQQWIPGGPTTLRFCNLFLDRGTPIARFDGRKAWAGPDGLGQGTVMEPHPDERVYQASLQLVKGLQLTGPLAVEFKQDANDELWLIEPNVGRTEYCLDVCVSNGVNFPYIEYAYVIGRELPAVRMQNRCVWFDTDRDPFAWLRFLLTRGPDPRALRPVFPYLHLRDMGPFFASCRTMLSRPFSHG